MFQDRLVSDKDRLWFRRLLETNVGSEFGLSSEQVLPSEVLLYGDFMEKGTDMKNYRRIDDPDQVFKLETVNVHFSSMTGYLPVQIS